MEAWIIYSLATVAIVAGLGGTIFPAIPGLPLMLAGFFTIAWYQDFQTISWLTLGALSIITLIGLIIDFIAGLLGAKLTGASKKALWWSVIGSIVGIFFGIFGMLLGPLVGAGLGEFVDKKDLYQAGKVGIGTFVGFILGTLAKIGCALSMILIFGFSLIF